MRNVCLAIIFVALVGLCLTRSSIGAELEAVPNIYGNELWVMKNGTIVKKLNVDNAMNESAIRIRGPRGGEIFFGCPPKQKPPQQTPPEQPPLGELPKFDMPGSLKAGDTTNADVSLATLAALAAGALGGVAGYKQQMNDPDLVEDAVKSETKTTPAIEVTK